MSFANRLNMLQVVWLTDMGSGRSYWQTFAAVVLICHFCKYLFIDSSGNIVAVIPGYPNPAFHFTAYELFSDHWWWEVRGPWKGWRLGGSGLQFSTSRAAVWVICNPTCGGMGAARRWHSCPDEIWILHTPSPSRFWRWVGLIKAICCLKKDNRHKTNIRKLLKKFSDWTSEPHLWLKKQQFCMRD